jgi:hypothetical protein
MQLNQGSNVDYKNNFIKINIQEYRRFYSWFISFRIFLLNSKNANNPAAAVME